ncbi:protein phosphatase 2C 57-like, partial [Trifolium pratense]
ASSVSEDSELRETENPSPSSSRNRNRNIFNSRRSRCYSAIAIDAPSSLTDSPPIRWGSVSLQGPREEMEDDIILRPDSLQGFSFAAVFDGHGGFASVQFLREELYKECLEALQDGLLLLGKDFKAVEDALKQAFAKADMKLLKWLEIKGEEEDESGATATAIFLGDNKLLISHIGDSSVVLCRSGKPELLTSPHRPYGSNKASLEEIKRIREADVYCLVSRLSMVGFVEILRYLVHSGTFDSKRRRMRCYEKEFRKEDGQKNTFLGSIQFKDDLVVARPDIYQVTLGSDAEFIVLASDGLWDYMSSLDAVTFVRDQLRKHGNTQLACESLAQVVLDQRTQDNVSIIIADLGKTDWKNLPLQQQNVIFELVQALATIGIVSVGIWFTSQLSL